MYLNLYFKDYGEIPVFIYDDSPFSQYLVEKLPIESKAIRWKEEFYFETPLEFKSTGKLSVSPGDVAFWPPGKALCLFYGLSQPYSPVSIVGEIIGPLYLLREIEEDEIQVSLDKSKGENGLVNYLRDRGFKAARREWMEYSSIAVVVELAESTYKVLPKRVGFDVYEEDYGFAVESDGLAFYDASLSSYALMHLLEALKKRISRNFGIDVFNKVRVDINEDGYICLSSFTSEREELLDLLRGVASLYVHFLDYLVGFST